MKYLVSAYGCEPGKGSESGVGWNWVKELSQKHSLWVITRENNRAVIESYGEKLDNVYWIYYDRPLIAKLVKKGAKGLYPYYFMWQCGIVKIAKKLNEEEKFDACMHVSFGSMWMPTFLYKINIPFIWGPIGGGEAIPKAYWGVLSKKERLMQSFRQILFSAAMLDPFFAKPTKNATKIIARTEESKIVFPPKYQSKIVTTLETAVDEDVLNMYAGPAERIHTMNMVYTGRLMSIKGVEIAIKALSKARHKDSMRFTIVGTGSREGALKKLVNELNLNGQVTFVGFKPREETLEIVNEAEVFVFPSLKEGGSWALMEAMALGKTCICHDSTGMHMIANSSCACMIEEKSVSYSIEQFSLTMDMLFENPDKCHELGRRAHERMKNEFTWAGKGKWIRKEI